MAYIKFPFNGKEFQIDSYLANVLNSLVYNVRNDWDFVILVTGDRSVRVGKSVFAMQIAAYLSYLLKELKLNDDAFSLDNVYFDCTKLMAEAPHKKQHSVIQYDEGREGLAAIKAMRGLQQDLIDFFTECGQLNHIFIIVLPDFFDLKEDMAVARSEILVNCYRQEIAIERDLLKTGNKLPIVEFKRGFYEFWNKPHKRKLYDIAKAKHIKNYRLVKPSYPPGFFPNEYVVDEEAYKKKKRDALLRFKESNDPKESREGKISRLWRLRSFHLINHLRVKFNYTLRELEHILHMQVNSLSTVISKNREDYTYIEKEGYQTTEMSPNTFHSYGGNTKFKKELSKL